MSAPLWEQDEWGGPNLSNYLCSFFAAQYVLELVVREAPEGETELKHRAEEVLADGLAWETLLDNEKKIFSTSADVTLESRWANRSIQFSSNALNFLPLRNIPEPTFLAFQQRRSIVRGGDSDTYDGWTLEAFALAAAHVNDASAVSDELARLRPADKTDAEFIQLYESSTGVFGPQDPAQNKAYYLTSHGLFIQTICDAIVWDYFEDKETTFGQSCPESWGDVEFQGFVGRDGKLLSGKRSNGQWSVSEDASRQAAE